MSDDCFSHALRSRDHILLLYGFKRSKVLGLILTLHPVQRVDSLIISQEDLEMS